VRRYLSLLLLGVTALSGGAGQASAQAEISAVDVVEVHGVIDPALASYVRDEIAAAERTGSAVVLQIDSRGSFGDEAIDLGLTIRSARVPVVAWVGPSGARAEGGALFIVYSSSLVAMAPGAGIGPARPFDLGTAVPGEDPAVVDSLGRELVSLASSAGAAPDGVRELLDGPPMPAGPALSSGAAQVAAANVTDLVRQLDGRSVRAGREALTLRTLGSDGRVAVSVRFHALGPVRRILHAVGTPTAVYVLVVLGLWAIAFELTQPGLGVAGLFGALALALAGYGLTVIPVRWLGLGLLLAGLSLQGLDVLLRRLGGLTLAGTAAFAAGSVLAWRGVAPAIDLSPWLIASATVAGAVFFGFGLTVALRARERVRSAQVGLVGLVGETRKDLDPEGAVFVKGTLWRARSADGPIAKGRRVRVSGIDGLVLRVEEDPE
jgi:membrane-bound serine protease (ClpP class)